jgi:hypothetical protein
MSSEVKKAEKCEPGPFDLWHTPRYLDMRRGQGSIEWEWVRGI